MRYRVYIQFIGSTSIEVEADSGDEAIEIALDAAPSNNFAHANYDASEWYVDDSAAFPAVEQV
jgi:hypothetical protein